MNIDLGWNFVFEIGVLCFFGFLYYVFQRKRIIRFDIQEVFNNVEEITYELNLYLDDKKSESYYEQVNNFNVKLEEISQTYSIPDLIEHLQDIPQAVPESIRILIDSLSERLKFYQN